MRPGAEGFETEDVTSVEDEKFDLIYPPELRALSSVFWTPVRIAADAARLLVPESGTRVLDVGCGPGKFCLVAATLTDGRFTGVEQRRTLVEAARRAADNLGIYDIDFREGNITDTPFADYDAFYIFNPFEENMSQGYKIDSEVPLSPELFKRYTTYVADQLGGKPLGTRVVTYMGYADEIPGCYSCELALFGDDLKLWVKKQEHDPNLEALRLTARRSYHGSLGWAPARTC